MGGAPVSYSFLALLPAVFRPSGVTAIWFGFVVHAAVGLGIALAFLAVALRIRAERGLRPGAVRTDVAGSA